MYFEDQKKQGRNRSFAQVESITNKSRNIQNSSQQQQQTVAKQYMQGSSHLGGVIDQMNHQSQHSHYHQEQSSQSMPQQHQYSSIATQAMLNKIKGQSIQYNAQQMNGSATNSGQFKGNTHNIQQNHFSNSNLMQSSASSQQPQQTSSHSSRMKAPSNTIISSILQEQHLNMQQNKSQVSTSNSALNRGNQLKNSSAITAQSIQNMGNCNSNNTAASLLNSNSQQTQSSLQYNHHDAHYQDNSNSYKRVGQQQHKAKQIQREESAEQFQHPQIVQGVHPSNCYNHLQQTSSTSGNATSQQQSVSTTNTLQAQQQQQSQQPLNKIKKHQRHHSEIAISKHIKQYSILGANLQIPSSIASNSSNINQAFSKESYNKENLNFYEIQTTGSSSLYNGIESHSNKSKVVSPHIQESLNKFGIKNESSNSQNQNYSSTSYTGKSSGINTASLRNPTSNSTLNSATYGSIGNTQSNTLKFEPGTSKEQNNSSSYNTLRQKHSRQNSLSILPTHHQFLQNGIEIARLDDSDNIQTNSNKNNGTSRTGEDMSNIHSNKNNQQQNLESLKVKKHPTNVQYTQKQDEAKKPALKHIQTSEGDLDKQMVASSVSSNDIRSKNQQNNGVKSNNFQNYSILAQEPTQSTQYNNQYSRRTSSILIGEVPQNCINLVENLSYQSTNRSIGGNGHPLSHKYEQINPNNNINTHIQNNVQPNKSATSSLHKSNTLQQNGQQQQLQKEGYLTQNSNNGGYGSNQNSATNLSFLNTQYSTHSNQTSTIPTPSNMNNTVGQQQQLNNKPSNTLKNEISNNSQFQFNVNQTTKVSQSTNAESKSQYTAQSSSTVVNAQNTAQGQSLSSHPTYRDADISYLQDYNPQSLIEKRRKSHSISNNIISSNSYNMKQAAGMNNNIPASTQPGYQPSNQSTSQNTSHQISTNSVLSQNVSNNNSQIISNGQTVNYLANNKNSLNTSSNNITSTNSVGNHFSSNLQVNSTNTVTQGLNKSNLSNQPNSHHANTAHTLITQNNANTSNVVHSSTQNYQIPNLSNQNSQNNLNKGYSSGSKSGMNNINSNGISQNNNNLSNISDQNKGGSMMSSSNQAALNNVKPANLTFAEQLKIDKQKKLNDHVNNHSNTIQNCGINSERNNKQNVGSTTTVNNSYSYCSNNSNNTSAICTPYATTTTANAAASTTTADTLPKNILNNYSSNQMNNNNLSSNNNNNNHCDGIIYSGKNSNNSSLHNTYVKPKENYHSQTAGVVDMLTNPNSSRAVTSSNTLRNQKEPLTLEQQAINALLQKTKEMQLQGQSNDSKYFTLQYSKLNKFDSEILLPTSAPAQIINPVFNNDSALTPQEQLSNLSKTLSNISNRKSSPSNSDQQNINQLKQTAKPCIIPTKIIDPNEIQSLPKSAKGTHDISGYMDSSQLPSSSRQMSQNTSIIPNVSNLHDTYHHENMMGVSTKINQGQMNPHLQNQIGGIKNYETSNQVAEKLQKVEYITYDKNNKPIYVNTEFTNNPISATELAKQLTSNYPIYNEEQPQQQETKTNKKQQMQNTKHIQQKSQQQPMKWYLHDSQAQFDQDDQEGRDRRDVVPKVKNAEIPSIKEEKVKKTSSIQNFGKVQPNIPEPQSIQQQLLNSESSSLTQISTYRDDLSNCIQNFSYLNNNSNIIGGGNSMNVKRKEQEISNYSTKNNQTNIGSKKDTNISEISINHPYSTIDQVLINKNEIGTLNGGTNFSSKAYTACIKDSYLMDFEDLAEYFNQNNGAKPSNNTPEVDNSKIIAYQKSIDAAELNTLCQSIESLSLQYNNNAYINIENQEEELYQNNNNQYLQNNKGDALTKKKATSTSPLNGTKCLEDLSSLNVLSSENLYKFNEKKKEQNLNDQSSMNELSSELSSYSNLYLNPNKQQSMKNVNDWEGLCQIDEGEYELKAQLSEGDEDMKKDNSSFSLDAVGEDLEAEDDMNSSQKQFEDERDVEQEQEEEEEEEFQENEEDYNLENNEESDMKQQDKRVDNLSDSDNVDDAQLMCEEEDLHEAMQSNISNMLNDINNDDPNQAFYNHNYYEQNCFNVESYSNYKNYNESYSNAPSNQKPQNDHTLSQNQYVAPFGEFSGQKSTFVQSSRSKPLQDAPKSTRVSKKLVKENEKENKSRHDDEMLIDDDIKQSQDDFVKKPSTKKFNVEQHVIHSYRSKEQTEKQTKEEKQAKLKKELEEFDRVQGQYPIFGGDHLTYLLSREADYQPNPNYLENQTQFNPFMRAILLDWMMEVSEEYGLKRETYYIAANTVDRMFSTSSHLQLKQFQLIGVTSLHIASKLEEIYPKKIEDFILSTDNGYTAAMINQTEQEILKKLNYMINPPTVSFWGNWFMSQWDIFVQTSEKAQNSSLNLQTYTENNSTYIQFKQANDKSYRLFREYMQIVDFTILHFETIKIKSTTLHCSIMYIVLGKAFGIFSEDNILNELAEGYILTESFNEFNELYNAFTGVSFGMTIDKIIPYIQYVSKFFILPITDAAPYVVSLQKQPLQGNYEDFLQYQTHNRNQIVAWKALNKGNK